MFICAKYSFQVVYEQSIHYKGVVTEYARTGIADEVKILNVVHVKAFLRHVSILNGGMRQIGQAYVAVIYKDRSDVGLTACFRRWAALWGSMRPVARLWVRPKGRRCRCSRGGPRGRGR
jgi:hypothetical protein